MIHEAEELKLCLNSLTQVQAKGDGLVRWHGASVASAVLLCLNPVGSRGLSVWSFSKCLQGFPHTVQRHAAQVNWKTLHCLQV